MAEYLSPRSDEEATPTPLPSTGIMRIAGPALSSFDLPKRSVVLASLSRTCSIRARSILFAQALSHLYHSLADALDQRSPRYVSAAVHADLSSDDVQGLIVTLSISSRCQRAASEGELHHARCGSPRTRAVAHSRVHCQSQAPGALRGSMELPHRC